ncbi:MAG: DUF4293 family protein [Flavobacteriales bacterium]|nr:DUF4293 family protein [Flavobacteriales bacterium]
MLQRKQSLWLGLIFFLCMFSVYFNIPFREIEGKLDGKMTETLHASIGFAKTEIDIINSEVKVKENIGLKWLVILTGLLALLNIFLFKKHSLQILICKLVFALVVLMAAAMYFYGWSIRLVDYDPKSQIIISVIFPLLYAYANFRALKGIRHDVSLIKSYDRIR